MADIIQNEGGKKKGKRRAKKHPAHVDMTPMVDLFCLLLTFFILTAAFSKPKMMEIALPEPPKDGDPPPPEISSKRALTVILDGDDRVFWYAGNANPLKPPLPTVYETDFSKDGIRKVLLNRNLELYKHISAFNDSVITGKIELSRDSVKSYVKQLKRTDKTSPIVLVKATDGATYGDMVNIVDELTITEVPIYSIVSINLLDKNMIAEYKKSQGE